VEGGSPIAANHPDVRIAGVEIPNELKQAAKALRRTHCLRLVCFASLAMIALFGVTMLISGTIDSGFIRSAVSGGVSGLAMWTAVTLATSVAKKRVHAFLREHGYCSCGYKAMPQGDGRIPACPECGSQWFRRNAVPPAA